MREAPFVSWILDVARVGGWTAYHVPAPMRAKRGGGFVGAREAAGLCDLILFHSDPPRLILAEVKGDGGRLTVEQMEFLRLAHGVADAVLDICRDRAMMTAATSQEKEMPIGVYTWRPGDAPLIEAVLLSKVMSP